jgi:hypothetical protein
VKNIFLSLALAAGLASFAGNADAQNTGKSFTDTGVVWTYTIDVSGMYQLTGFGGSGQGSNERNGGFGAGIKGTLDLMAGTTLDIVIGQGFTDHQNVSYGANGANGGGVLLST